VDVTDIARGLIGCVESCRQRYGVNVIIDTVHGANTAKIRNYRMDQSPHYSEFAKVPAYKLRQVMNHLMLNEFLMVTNDEYAIVKLTEKSGAVLLSDEAVVMKMAKEQEHLAKVKEEKKTRKSKLSGVSGASLSEADEALFEILRALRTEIAKEEKVPPYIVFSDKTLIHMCVVKPRTKTEMLSVSGVGEFKYEKYGERFLDCVREECGELGDGYIENEEPAGTEIVAKKANTRKTKTEFVMTKELEEQIYYSKRISISDFVRHINDLRDEEAMKRLTIKLLEEKLLEVGCFEVYYANGVALRRLADKGVDFGIEAEKRVSEKGNEYYVFFCTEKAQRGIVQKLLGEWLVLE